MWGWLVHQRGILALSLLVPISTPGGERHCESKESNYPRTQHNVPGLRA